VTDVGEEEGDAAMSEDVSAIEEEW